MAIVYVPHKPDNTIDYRGARQWGEVRVLLEGAVPIHSTAMMEKFMEEGLKEYGPEDMVVLGGNNFVMALTLAIVLGRHGQANLLQYNRRHDRYDRYVLRLGLKKQ